MDASLVWSVKRTLISYVEGMSDGRIDVDGGAIRRGDDFVFPAMDDGWFAGSVTFSGHYGMLFLPLGGIRIMDTDHGGLLSIDDDDITGGRRTLLDLGRAVDVPDGRSYPSPRLTEEGSELFFDTYRSGSAFDAVRVRDED